MPKNEKFLLYADARKYVRKLELKSQKEWREFTRSKKFPDFLPKYPEGVYKNQGWNGYGDWLGNGKVANQDRVYKSFELAREYVHSLKLSCVADWQKVVRQESFPKDIP